MDRNVSVKAEHSCGVIVVKKCDKSYCILTLLQDNSFYHRKNNDKVVDIGPKGHMNPGESESEAALRETLEETGMSVNLLPGFKSEYSYEFDVEESTGSKLHVKKTVTYFAAIVDDKALKGIALSPEHISYRFEDINNYKRITNFEAQKRVLEELRDYLEGAGGTGGV